DRTLAKDPALRYENAGDLANEFIALFNGQTISPGTLHIAQLAREAAVASRQQPAPQPERSSTRWTRIGIEVAVVAILGLFIMQFLLARNSNLSATPTALDPNA